MLILFSPEPGNNGQEAESGKQLAADLARALPAGRLEVYGEIKEFEQRLRRRIFDIRLVVCCLCDFLSLEQIEGIETLLDGLPVILVVSPEVGRETVRLYRLYPKSVLCLQGSTGWIVDFVRNKLMHEIKEDSYV